MLPTLPWEGPVILPHSVPISSPSRSVQQTVALRISSNVQLKYIAGSTVNTLSGSHDLQSLTNDSVNHTHPNRYSGKGLRHYDRLLADPSPNPYFYSVVVLRALLSPARRIQGLSGLRPRTKFRSSRTAHIISDMSISLSIFDYDQRSPSALIAVRFQTIQRQWVFSAQLQQMGKTQTIRHESMGNGRVRRKTSQYSRRDLLVITHPATNLPIRGFRYAMFPFVYGCMYSTGFVEQTMEYLTFFDKKIICVTNRAAHSFVNNGC